MEESIRLQKHVTIVGGIHIGLAIFWFFAGLFAFFLMDFARGFIPEEDVPDAVMKLISVVMTTIPLIVIIMSALRLAGGIGLLMKQIWARYVIIVVSILGMFKIPIGTLIGVYSLWVLMQTETVNLFEKK